MRPVATPLLVTGALVAAAQFIRLDRTAPPAGSDIAAPLPVESVLRRACYDCHSSQTEWPWYSQIAPLSWLIDREVREGRRRLNFSDWGDYASDPGTAALKLDQIATRVTAGDMAPWYYCWLHPEARLTPDERELLVHWARSGSTAPSSAG